MLSQLPWRELAVQHVRRSRGDLGRHDHLGLGVEVDLGGAGAAVRHLAARRPGDGGDSHDRRSGVALGRDNGIGERPDQAEACQPQHDPPTAAHCDEVIGRLE